jgi:hypothetical protein
MTVDQAFKVALKLVRDAGIAVQASEVPVLAAWNVFEKRSKGLEFDPRYVQDGPQFAQRLILEALMAAENTRNK